MADKFEPRHRQFIESLTALPFDPDAPDPEEFDAGRMKSEIANGPADPETFGRRFREFAEYLDLVETFYREVADQPEGSLKWEYQFQYALQLEALQLRRKLNQWDARESDHQLDDLLRPLWADLESLDGREYVPKPAVEREREVADPDDIDELEQRVEAVHRLLVDRTEDHEGGKYLDDILRFVDEHQGDGGKRLSGGHKRRATSALSVDETGARLHGHRGLIESSASGYRMTRRGVVVLETFENLDSIGSKAELVTMVETVFELNG